MGIESANYHFIPNQNQSENLSAVLNDLRPTSKRRNMDFDEAAFVGDNFWIDTQLGCFQKLKFQSLSIRIALCNPPEVTDELRRMLSHLLTQCGGYVFEKESNVRFDKLDDGEWTRLKTNFLIKQEEFFKLFGKRYTAISADKVFDYFR